ncbi:golvesin C-terminal-like domain-containing protein [Streptomyces sp. 24-1644]|uniref:golvesin C-terminal-like domain-containing protein n=1 Tax=Streptomyces sp. 24-1644 TaxID=3457315 RepID=UPI003FA6F053
MVTYVDSTTESTYFAPQTPARMTPNSDYTVDFTLTNTTAATWNAADQVLSYKWTLPDGTDVTNGGNQVRTALPSNVAPGDSVSLQAQVKTPINSDNGNKRTDYVLTWDVYNKTTGTWASGTAGIPGLRQNVAVEDPTSNSLGMEKFYAYAGANTGSASSVMNNLSSGNTVWSYDAFANPGRGLGTFARFAYNSQDTSDTVLGHGWSGQLAGPVRLGAPLDFHPKPHPTEIRLPDGDGTTHVFRKQPDGSWKAPAGVHYKLTAKPGLDCTPEKDPIPDAWTLMRPDGTRFLFGCDGYMTSIVDNNGNTQTYTYEERKSNNKPTKFLTYITDPADRQSLTVTYFTKADGVGPKIADHVKSVTDVSGRKLAFEYSDKGLLTKLTDGAGSTQPKVFLFEYDATQGNKNVKLVSVTDPRGNPTKLTYNTPSAGDDPKYHWWSKKVTDRTGGDLSFVYAQNAANPKFVDTRVTDARTQATSFVTDDFGRPVQTTNTKSQTTKMSWDADNNVTYVEENNGAKAAYCYDQKTGYPLWQRTAEQNKAGVPPSSDCAPGVYPANAQKYEYQTRVDGYSADLFRKTSPEGRAWQFGYDTFGNLTAVTDPKGVATPTVGDYTTTYTYDGYGQMLTAKDAANTTTTYSDYEPAGYPRTTKDALNKTSTVAYGPRGEVTSSTNELGHTVTQNYDVYGRPTDGRTPKDQAAGVYIANPAPVYDANDNITTSTAPNGAVHTAVYDAGDQVTSFSDPKDTPTGQARTTTYTYDAVGNQLSVTLPKGNLAGAAAGAHTTTYTYDELNRPVTITDAFGNRTTASYDDVGNVSTVVDPLKNNTAAADDYSASYTYDLDHRPVSTKDPAGYTRSTTYDKDGLTLSATDENGNTVLSTYDERGQVTQVRAPHDKPGGTITYNTTKYEYDVVGRQTAVITPRGVASGRADAFTAKTVYDELGRVKARLSPYDANDPVYNKPVQTDYTYDAVSRLTKVSAPPSKGETTRNDTTYSYFDNGWVKSSTDPWDIVASYEYNTLGLQTRRTLTSAGGSSSRTMNWGYFPDGKLQTRSDTGVPAGLQVVLVDNSDTQNVSKTGTWTSSSSGTGLTGHDYATHAAGAGTDAFTWETTIPEDGTYQVYVKYPAVTGAATTASYKVEHNGGSATKPVDQTKNAGAWVSLGSYGFKAGGASPQRVSLAQNAGGTVVADAVKLVRDNSGDTQLPPQSFGYSYDVNGNMTDLTDGSPGSRYDAYAFTYDARDRLTRLQEKAAGSVKHTTGFGYDADSNIVSQTHDARSATFDYDVRGLLSKVVNKESATDPSPKTTSYTRTPAGQFATQTKGNGNVATFQYYLDSSLKESSERTSGGTLVAEHSLTYDPNGNRTKDVSTTQNADNHAAYLSRTSTNVYTPRDQIASVRNSDGSSPQDYAYDDNGNITSQNVGGSPITNTYSRDRLLSSSTPSGTIKYNYDPFGRMDTVTGAGVVLEKFTYDGYDRIKSQQNNNGAGLARTDFTYDAFGRTVSEVKGAGTGSAKTTVFDYLAMGGAVVSETVDGILKKSYQYSPMGERLSQIVHGTGGTKDYTYYTYNPHSDVAALTDDQGNTKATYGYTAYGAQDDTQMSGADKPGAGGGAGAEPYNAYRFNSARVDTASGNYNMGFRTYSTGMNRFLSRDMYNGALSDMRLASDPVTGNRYAFAGGNPLSNVELDGHSWLSSNGRPSFAVDSAGTVTDLVDEMMNTIRDHYIRTTKVKGRTYVGAYDPATGRYAAGLSSNPFGCAERDCARKLGLPMDQVRFGNAISYQRPSKQPIIGVCENCQNDSARSQYPADAKWKPGGRFDSGRAIHTSPGELAIPSRASTELVAVRSTQAASAAAARTSSAGAASSGSSFASKLSTAAKWGGRGLLGLGVGVAAYEVWSAPDGEKGEAAVSAGSTLAGGLAGAWGGAKVGAVAGAAIGSIIPGAGTAVGGVVGGVVGGIAGGIAGSYVGSKAGDFLNSLW